MQQGPALDEQNFQRHPLCGVPEGYDSVFLAGMARQSPYPVLHIAADDTRLEQVYEGLLFFAPDITVLRFPAWDCLPFDRVSPTGDVMGERLKTLSRLLRLFPSPQPSPGGRGGVIILTTIAAATQRVPPRAALEKSAFDMRAGARLDMTALQSFLAANGYHRTETVREAGEFAQRGGLFDIFPSGAEEPLRLDLFGEEIESIRAFDPLSQRTTEEREGLSLYPVSEVLLNEESIHRFRARYREAFGAVRDDDPLYESVSAGRKYAGMEHWISFFYDALETLADYLPNAMITLDHQVEESRQTRLQQIEDLYDARMSLMNAAQKGTAVYRPAPMEDLYLSGHAWSSVLGQHEVFDLSPFPPAPGQRDAGGRKARDFSSVRAQPDADLYAEIRDHIRSLNKPVLIAAYSEGSKERLSKILTEYGVKIKRDEALPLPNPLPEGEGTNGSLSRVSGEGRGEGETSIAVLGLDHGFETEDFCVLTEQDLLGDRLTRIAKKKKKSENFIFEVSQLHEGDYVVHEEHGIGQFLCLETVVVDDIPHDCLKLLYAGNDKLFVPVENLDVLSRYGSAEAGAVLDKLGGVAWQSRRAKVKKDLLELAEALLAIAAQRVLRKTEPVNKDEASYDKFSAGFPYPETEDQQKAIDAVLRDLSLEQPMDRLVCGDVGFGKTEVALRAAAVVAMAGFQVALIAPTTLLARQHYQTFQKRFNGMPVRIGLLSRFVTGKEAERVKDGVARGDVDILIGTHALLSESIKFRNLGLLVVDEEQKFGVKQKERLKELKDDVHVLTLTATPIPRTLQMALTGVRELSLITTAPIDRLAIRTFVLPFDPVVIRDALMREHHRGGQSFYVCPRIADLEGVEETLREIVPDLKIIVAHGRMGAEEMEAKMTAFYEGAYDVLLSTSIVESGLDIPNANTMVIHRADMFGLAQMYQMRGRIGRGKQRAYAYLTYDADKKLTKGAADRLHVIEQLDTLGAGFQLASHDLDLRGAGNLLGEEQSGHIKEIGVELYQQMLEEAVAVARTGRATEDEQPEAHFAPAINMGMPVMIPEGYIKDLNLRLSIYRRIAALADRAEIEGFAAELIDRFGPLPKDVENLLDLVEIKQLCRQAGVDRIDAGPKGAVVSFHPLAKLNLPALVAYISKQSGTVKLRSEDQKLVFMRPWEDLPDRVKGVHKVLKELAAL
ncbi:MAG: transcription-repair coupling factor [Alphaproteobacteria bacterium]|nr:transcription-repair coupling factor [Alphaproteobacteria bacterium]